MRQKARRHAAESKPSPWEWEARVAALDGKWWAYTATSLVVLIPCWWQTRIQAGDLSSHVYNAWLASLAERGTLPGIRVVAQATNILFDLLLSGTMRMFGPVSGPRVAISIAVLVFFWGAFHFASVSAGRKAWPMVPLLAVLSYGWVFRMGFLNFYLGLGLSFVALALWWQGSPVRMAAGTALLVVACVAHALPAGWAAAVLLYRWLAGIFGPRRGMLTAGIAVALLLIVRIAVGSLMSARWVDSQLWTASGLDQAYVYDTKYAAAVAVFAIALALPLGDVFRNTALVSSLLFRIAALTALGIIMLPSVVQIPGYRHQIAFVADRMSLAVGVCLCALAAQAPVRKWGFYAAVATFVVFFAFTYADERLLNRVEDQMAKIVMAAPRFQRVAAPLEASGLRMNPLEHMIDRICIDRCYSYANYEPATAQFRVRVEGVNPIVVSTIEDSWRIGAGVYVVQERDLPLYVIRSSPAGFELVSVPAGGNTGISRWTGF